MFQFKQYTEKNENEWDKFVLEESINGTFLQSRRFLNYHPVGRFEDCSLMIFDEKNNLCAVIPACVVEENSQKNFFSHKGSTFGGVILKRKYYRAKYVIPLIEELKIYLQNESFDEVYLKITSNIFSVENNDLLQYAFKYHGFQEHIELSTYIDYDNYKEDILANFGQGKRTNVHNCQKAEMCMQKLMTNQELEDFYVILCSNLEKYNTKPVHTLDELQDFKNNRLKSECEFFGCYLEKEMVAGAMMFYFDNVRTAHTQYLAAKSDYSKLSPMTFLYYSLIDEMKKRNYKTLSWGIATEKMGQELNMGLITSKEEFGSVYCNNLTYYFDLKKG